MKGAAFFLCIRIFWEERRYIFPKHSLKGSTIKQLNEEETIEEIARIASGEVTKIAKAHAKELRKAS